MTGFLGSGYSVELCLRKGIEASIETGKQLLISLPLGGHLVRRAEIAGQLGLLDFGGLSTHETIEHML